MPVYILTSSFLFISSFSSKPRRFYKCGFLLLFFLSAFRHISTGGYDAGAYLAFYNRVPDIFNLSGFDSQYQIGYTLLNSLVKTITNSNDYYWFQFFYTVVTFILLWLVLEELTITDSERLLLLFAYFCYKFMWYEWGTCRQNIADLFFWLYALRLGKCDRSDIGKKIILLLKLLIIPYLFHSSAVLNVVFLPIMFIIGKFSIKTRTIITLIASVILFFIGEKIVAPVLDIMITNVDDRYMMYMSKLTDLQSSNIVNTFLRLGFFLFYAFVFDRIELQEKNTIFNFLMMMVMIGSVDLDGVGRIYEYYAIGLYTTMAIVLRAFRRDNGSKLVALLLFFIGFEIIMIRFVSMGTRYLYEFKLWF